jgi:hypothetical protein
MTDTVTIVLFAYDRPEHTHRTLKSLQRNTLASSSKLVIYLDNARSESDAEKVLQVKNIVENISGFKSIEIIRREYNYGLARNIISGITEVISQDDKVIILEDDLVLSPYFLDYMNKSLEIYKDKPEVMSISAYVPQIDVSNLNDTFFTYFTSCWGWGTWKRSWDLFERQPAKLLKTFTPKDIYKFNLNGTCNYWEQVLKNHQGNLQTWAIFWYATVFQHNGLVLYPNRSLVENFGFDGSGSHCGFQNTFTTSLRTLPVSYYESRLENNFIACEAFFEFYKKIKPSFVKRFINKVNRVRIVGNDFLS